MARPGATTADVREEAIRLHTSGDLAAAEPLYRQLMRGSGADAELRFLFGLLRFQQGRHAEALDNLARSLRARPDHAATWALSGLAEAALGRFAEAVAAYDRSLALEPARWDVHSNRAVALSELGRSVDALASCDRALALRPDAAEAHNNRGNALRDLGEPAGALAAYDAALALVPFLTGAHDNRGRVLAVLGRPREALANHAAALSLDPTLVDARRGAERLLDALDDPVDALAELAELPARHAAGLLAAAGDVMARRGALAAALDAHDRAGALDPGDSGPANRKAILLAEWGRFDEAAAILDRAIASSPREPVLYYNYGLFVGIAPGHRYRDALADLERDATRLTFDQQVYLRFAQGKAAEDAGDVDGAFAHLRAGNALVRSRLAHDPSASETLARRIGEVFVELPPLAGPDAEGASPRPIFIVGMPRSGSTLVEQILAGHSRAVGAGEIDAFRPALDEIEASIPYPEVVPTLSAPELRALGGAYRARLPAVPDGVDAIVDKTLVDLWYVGLIHLALPEARFVHVVRDPVDTCLSCFAQRFNTDQPFAYDLGDLGRYHRACDAVLAHWRGILPPGTMMELRYEDLVGDPERGARRLLAHCGLDWEPGCLDMRGEPRRVRTASLAEIRRPISAASIGRRRGTGHHLGPLLEALGLDPHGTARPESRADG